MNLFSSAGDSIVSNDAIITSALHSEKIERNFLFLVKLVNRMVHVKNDKTTPKFVTVIQRKL